MTTNVDYHDYEIFHIEYCEPVKRLSLGLISCEGRKVLLRFGSVFEWNLTPFQIQNVIYELKEFSANNVPSWILEGWEMPPPTAGLKLYFIDASVGLGGCIVAKTMTVGSYERDESLLG